VNELTRKIVIATALENKSAVRNNPAIFEHRVISAYWDEMVSLYGVDLKQRALDLWCVFHPEHFEDGFLRDYDFRIFDIEMALSNLVMRVLRRKVARTPELQLSRDWGDLPKLTVDPQLELF